MPALGCSLFFATWLLNAQEPPPSPSATSSGDYGKTTVRAGSAGSDVLNLCLPVAVLASQPWWDPAITADCTCVFCLAGNTTGVGPPTTLTLVQQNRTRFARRIRMGRLIGFDDTRRVVSFKRNEQERPSRDPGPMEDEATASAARNALAPEYARLKLKFKLSCTAGNVSIIPLPDDLAQAAAVLDNVLVLDGVRTVNAPLPARLCLP